MGYSAGAKKDPPTGVKDAPRGEKDSAIAEKVVNQWSSFYDNVLGSLRGTV